MRGKILFNILDALKDGAMDFINLQEAILRAGYGATSGKIQYELRRVERKRNMTKMKTEEEYRILNRYGTMLSRLKNDGLIIKSGRGRSSIITITRMGLKKLRILKEKRDSDLPVVSYEKNDDDKMVIVIFDIPEKERRKRDWLREVLKNLGFRMVQKSVWFGKVKIPKEFLDDLRKLKIVEFVEIFEITKTGSLHNIT